LADSNDCFPILIINLLLIYNDSNLRLIMVSLYD
jgi:hypothetical protein